MSVSTVLIALLSLGAATPTIPSIEHSTSDLSSKPSGTSSSSITLSIPSSVPPGAHGPISHSWLGWGIEGGSFPDYAGSASKPNLFSQNLIDTISNRTGAPSIIRVGGTSLDHSKLSLSQKEPVSRGNGHPRSTIIGPSFFESFKHFPNSLYTMEVPFAPENLSYAVDFANRSMKYIGQRLSSIEIGNEPEAYIGVDRPKNWTLQDYVAQWKLYASTLTQKLPLPKGPIFEGLSLASMSYVQHPTWTVENAYKAGYFNDTRLKTISQHYYEVKGEASLTATLLNHSYTVNQTNRFRAPIDFMRSTTPHVDFILGEVGSSLEGSSRNKTKNIEFADGLGAAIWTLDWMLYAMSIGVQAVSMQQGANFTFSAWIPTPSLALGIGPTVFAPYMAHVAAADFIGRNNCSALSVAALNISDPHVSAYVGYRAGKVAQVAAINLQSWTGDGTRPAVTVSIPVGSAVGSVSVRRLTGANTNAHENVTWAGETWSSKSNGLPVKLANATETVPVSRGVAKVTIAASEAVLVDVGGEHGTHC